MRAHPGGGAGLADDLDVVFRLQQRGHPAPHDLVIVEQEDTNHATNLGTGGRQGKDTFGPAYGLSRPNSRLRAVR